MPKTLPQQDLYTQKVHTISDSHNIMQSIWVFWVHTHLSVQTHTQDTKQEHSATEEICGYVWKLDILVTYSCCHQRLIDTIHWWQQATECNKFKLGYSIIHILVERTCTSTETVGTHLPLTVGNRCKQMYKKHSSGYNSQQLYYFQALSHFKGRQ